MSLADTRKAALRDAKDWIKENVTNRFLEQNALALEQKSASIYPRRQRNMWMAGEVEVEIRGEEFFPWLIKACGIEDDDLDEDPIIDIDFKGSNNNLDQIVVKTKGGGVIQMNGPEEFWEFFYGQLPRFIRAAEWLAPLPRWSKENECVCITLAFDTENHPATWGEKPTFMRDKAK